MKYDNMERAVFLERPNRFIAYVETARGREICHVKNTGRCKELLIPGAEVYVERNHDPGRKTPLDLITVVKEHREESDGLRRLINMDSQAPNAVVLEALKEGRLIPGITSIKPEYTYGDSRFDFYVETEEKQIFIEVKGVTLERDGYAAFPDAPTERGVKHIRELIAAKQAGYETWLLFVVQMRPIFCVIPNDRTHAAFGDALREARAAGVHVCAYDCSVEMDSLVLGEELPVLPDEESLLLTRMTAPLTDWFKEHARVLPWREREAADGSRIRPNAYEIWVSEIMLQQTRVEAVKGYYARFMDRLPGIRDLAYVPQDELLKLWEGLGYYNRVRNMQKAARQIVEQYGGVFPEDPEEILKLPGIGSYTAGAIASNAYDRTIPAVDGNVLRVLARFLALREDIGKPQTKKRMEQLLLPVIPKEKPGLFNQALMEIGACVCVPNGQAKCEGCPLSFGCRAYKEDLIDELPVKAGKKARRIEKHTILLVRNGKEVLIRKRPAKGLLAGLYEFLNLEGHLTAKQAEKEVENLGLDPIYVEKLEPARHIFSHVEWVMEGYLIQVAEPAYRAEKAGKDTLADDGMYLSTGDEPGKMLFADAATVQERYAIPSAYRAYTDRLTIRQGNEAL